MQAGPVREHGVERDGATVVRSLRRRCERQPPPSPVTRPHRWPGPPAAAACPSRRVARSRRTPSRPGRSRGATLVKYAIQAAVRGPHGAPAVVGERSNGSAERDHEEPQVVAAIGDLLPVGRPRVLVDGATDDPARIRAGVRHHPEAVVTHERESPPVLRGRELRAAACEPPQPRAVARQSHRCRGRRPRHPQRRSCPSAPNHRSRPSGVPPRAPRTDRARSVLDPRTVKLAPFR